MTIDQNRILKPRDIGKELIDLSDELDAIKDRFPDLKPHVLRKRLYASLWLPVSVTGIASRLILRHSDYLRYWTPIRSFVAYDRQTKAVGEWRPVPERNMRLLVRETTNHLPRELAILDALIEAGRIERYPEQHAAVMHQLIAFVTKTPGIVDDILDALKPVLAQPYVVTGQPCIATDEARIAKTLLRSKLPVKRGPRKPKVATDAVA